jgi:toxin-antitoxin system PIN domain toxin
VIVPDANLLLYAYDVSASAHERARSWWEEALSSSETVGLSWQTLTAFLRIGTNPRAYLRPLAVHEAVGIVQAWLAQPNAQIVTPSARHWDILQRLIVESQAIAGLVMDAHLAALAIEHGATLCTHDADFSRFQGLRTHDPLTA